MKSNSNIISKRNNPIPSNPKKKAVPINIRTNPLPNKIVFSKNFNNITSSYLSMGRKFQISKNKKTTKTIRSNTNSATNSHTINCKENKISNGSISNSKFNNFMYNKSEILYNNNNNQIKKENSKEKLANSSFTSKDILFNNYMTSKNNKNNRKYVTKRKNNYTTRQYILDSKNYGKKVAMKSRIKQNNMRKPSSTSVSSINYTKNMLKSQIKFKKNDFDNIKHEIDNIRENNSTKNKQKKKFDYQNRHFRHNTTSFLNNELKSILNKIALPNRVSGAENLKTTVIGNLNRNRFINKPDLQNFINKINSSSNSNEKFRKKENNNTNDNKIYINDKNNANKYYNVSGIKRNLIKEKDYKNVNSNKKKLVNVPISRYQNKIKSNIIPSQRNFKIKLAKFMEEIKTKRNNKKIKGKTSLSIKKNSKNNIIEMSVTKVKEEFLKKCKIKKISSISNSKNNVNKVNGFENVNNKMNEKKKLNNKQTVYENKKKLKNIKSLLKNNNVSFNNKEKENENLANLIANSNSEKQTIHLNNKEKNKSISININEEKKNKDINKQICELPSGNIKIHINYVKNDLFDEENLEPIKKDYDDEFTDIYSVVKKINFGSVLVRAQGIFTSDGNIYQSYKENFDKNFEKLNKKIYLNSNNKQKKIVEAIRWTSNAKTNSSSSKKRVICSNTKYNDINIVKELNVNENW